MNAEAQPVEDMPAQIREPVAPAPTGDAAARPTTLPVGIRFIGAGAGSGKTSRLAERLHARLAAGDVRPEAVIATTFTRRAAAELRERVGARLLAAGGARLAAAFGQARIGTVNSLCGELLERHAFAAGLPPRLRVLDEAAAEVFLAASIDRALHADALDELAQCAARLGIDDWSGAVLRTLIAAARSNGLDAPRLAACGPGNAAALLAAWPAPDPALPAAMQAALAAAIPAAEAVLAAQAKPVRTSERYVETLRRLVRESADADGAPWSQWLRLLNEDSGRRIDAAVAPVRALAGRLAAHPGLHADLRAYLARIFALAAAALDDFQARKAEAGYVDFVDQEHRLLALLARPDIRAQLAGELDLLLVDEFQDTSPLQLALFLALAGCARETVWVGDPKQAIYGFRGSDPALVQAVLAALRGAGAAHEVLDRSWRTRPALVQLVNAAFVPAFADACTAAEVRLAPMRAEPPAPAPALLCWTLAGARDDAHAALAAGLHALRSGPARVQDRAAGHWRPLGDDGDGADRTCSVQDRAAGHWRPPDWGDIAILARRHATLGRLARVLRAHGIPVALGEPGLLERPEALLALAALRRYADAQDTLASAEIVALADGRAPGDWLPERLDWLAAGGAPAQWREHGAHAQPLLVRIAALRSAGRALLAPAAALQRIVAETGLDACVRGWCADAAEAQARLANLDAVLELAADYEAQCATLDRPASVTGLLLWLRARAAAGEDRTAATGGAAVRLLTHHGAKGLEWPVTVLLELDTEPKAGPWGLWAQDAGRFDPAAPLAARTLHYWPWPFGLLRKAAPLDFVAGLPAAQARRAAVEAEERRLLYVSLTRARDVLVLARPASAGAAPAGGFASLAAPWLWPVPGATRLTLPDGADIACLSGALTAAAAPAAARAVQPLHAWSAPARTGAANPEPRPLRVAPAAAAPLACRCAAPERFGERLVLAGTPDPVALGNALHACLAASFTDPDAPLGTDEIAAILDGHALAGAVGPAAVAQRIAALHAWLARRWPGWRAHAEWPVEQRLADGQVLHGRIDLLLEGPDGWVLIDHKAHAGAAEAWPALAAGHAGQLAAYAAAVERASGRPVVECWLHFPVAGGAIRLDFA